MSTPPFISQISLRSAHRCGSRCRGGHHSYLANDQTINDPARDRFIGSGTHLALATTAATAASAATTVASTREGDADKGLPGDGVVPSPGRRRRGGGGWNNGGYFRGDHYCRVRVGRKGLPSAEGEVRRVSSFFEGVLRVCVVGGEQSCMCRDNSNSKSTAVVDRLRCEELQDSRAV